ncbi:MAG: alpha/beta hydrolase [Vicinamibacterales bacterium]
MPLHPQARAIIDIMASMGLSMDGDPIELRRLLKGFPRPQGEPVGAVADRRVPGPAGEVPVRVYTPADVRERDRPAMIWFHGGGWVIGDLDGADFSCRALANRAGCTVVSVDYRLAPEAKFPAAVDDCVAVTEWVAANASALGIDVHRIAVGGDSAGANLATVVSLVARDRRGPALAFQALVYPATNHSFDTVSYRDNADGYLLTRDSMVWFWTHYLEALEDGANPLASPLRAADLSGLPPAIVLTAEFDPLRDEGEAYAERLRAAGVPVEAYRYDGQIHGFYANPAIDDGVAAVERVAASARRAWEARAHPSASIHT